MSIVNKSKNTYFPDICLEYLRYPGEYVEKYIKSCFSGQELKDLQKEYSKRYNPKTGKFDPVIIDWVELIHYLHVAEDLIEWQRMGMKGCKSCKAQYFSLDEENNRLVCEEDYDLYMCLDGYAQYKSWCKASDLDTQCFANDFWVNVFVANVEGGICCHIDKKTSQIKFYGIGEDDGYWFIVNELWIQDIPMLKRYLMSEVSELRIEGLDHQKVIENIWNSDLSVETKYRH